MAFQKSNGTLATDVRDMHRALESLREELDAVNAYNERVETCGDPELTALLVHNRDEEKEHVAMLLEWIRRQDSALSTQLSDHLFSTRPLIHA